MISKIADIRPGEGVQVARATAVLFAVIAGHTLLETTRDALFLGELPVSRLAVVYGVLAILALFATRANRTLLARFGQRSSLFLMLVGSAYAAVVFYLLPHSKLAIMSLYIYSGLFASIAIVQFWMLTSRWFTVAQGKRLFGLISSGGVLGAVFGASLAICVLPALGVSNLLLLAAGCFLVAALALTGMQDDLEVGADKPRPIVKPGISKVLRGHSYLTLLTVLLALSTAALLVTDYLFKSVAARAFAPEDLGSFFARYYAGLNAVALLVQLVLSGYMVRRLGVVAAFLVLPLLLLGGAAAVLALGGLLALVLLTKGADGGLRHSLHRVSSELLWMPVPDDVRAPAKSFIDTVVVRASQAGTAALLLFLASEGWDDPRTLSLTLGLLLLGWLGFGWGLRKPYLALFREALARGNKGSTELDLDLNAVEVVVEALSSRDPTRVIAAIELLSANGRSRLIPALILYHESEEVLDRALAAIASPDRKDWIPLAERLLDHESERVRVAAMRALSRAGISTAAEGRLADPNPEVRGHAAYLVADRGNPEDPSRHPALAEVLSGTGAEGAAAKRGLLDSIRVLADRRYLDTLYELAQDSDESVLDAAALTMTELHDERFIPFLIRRLAVRRHRGEVRDALAAHGDAALESLTEALESPSTDAAIRRHIPRTIAVFGTQRAADVLLRKLGRETRGLVRYKILKGLAALVREHPVSVDKTLIEEQLKLNLAEHVKMALYASYFSSAETNTSSNAKALLGELLEDKAEQALERAFQLLNISHRHEDIRSVAAAVRSPDRQVRARALEYLDALTLDSTLPGLRGMLGVVADDLPVHEKARRLSAELPELAGDARAALSELLRDSDETLAAIAAYFALEFDDAAFAPEIAALRDNERASLFGGQWVQALGAGREPSLVK